MLPTQKGKEAMAVAIKKRQCLPYGRITRGNVIENSADAFPRCPVRVTRSEICG